MSLNGLHIKPTVESQFVLLLLSVVTRGPQQHWPRFWKNVYSDITEKSYELRDTDPNDLLNSMILKYKKPLAIISKNTPYNMLTSVLSVMKVMCTRNSEVFKIPTVTVVDMTLATNITEDYIRTCLIHSCFLGSSMLRTIKRFVAW